ncbi:MAG: AmmeMemoRadiSam system protein B [Candidatus Krumholzibacteriota bacterium]|nr:AmmeMemoRadiSam system protein B [Candidatus Krumholzibacteriota bacterium]
MNSSLPRRPSAAGLFYPADPDDLRRSVDTMLEAVPRSDSPGLVRMVLSPHAGYEYSGAIASAVFQRLRGQGVDTVVLVGPSHVEQFDHTSVYTGVAYDTPLGPVAVNRDLANRIAGGHSTIVASENGHVQPRLSRGEHGLEVQLPFLQRTHPDVTIVPIVMGVQDWEHCAALGETLLTHCPSDVVLLASSDLSHFYDYEHARRLDGVFLETLAELDPKRIFDGIRDGRCEACGSGPVIATLIASLESGVRYHEIARANSGDVTGDLTSVVGYASAVVELPWLSHA